MKKTKTTNFIIIFILIFSLCFNIYFVVKKEKSLGPELIGTTILRASKNSNLDLLKEVTVNRDDEYWQKKLNVIQGKDSNRAIVEGFCTIKYDNGNTLIIELSEDPYKHNIKAADFYFVDFSNLDFLKFNNLSEQK